MTDTSDRLLLTETHPVTRRMVVLEDDGASAWAFLTRPGDLQLEADTWVYNRGELRRRPGAPARASAPPAPPHVTSGTESNLDPDAHRWSFLWNARGDVVAILKDGEPLALLESGRARGMSKLLRRTCAWGEAWSQARWANTGMAVPAPGR